VVVVQIKPYRPHPSVDEMPEDEVRADDEMPAVPGEDGIGLGNAGYLLERTATEALADLSECGSPRIEKANTRRKMRSENPILGGPDFLRNCGRDGL
jgi:hypothetical protein